MSRKETPWDECRRCGAKMQLGQSLARPLEPIMVCGVCRYAERKVDD